MVEESFIEAAMPTMFTRGIRIEVAEDVLSAAIAHWAEAVTQALDAVNLDPDHLAVIQAEQRKFRALRDELNPGDFAPILTRFRVYDTQTARWISRDSIAEAGGIHLYGYVGGNPVSYVDPFRLETNVTVWQPLGLGESSFGHVSTEINGTTYSFGSDGMSVMPTSDYAARNGFRHGIALKINLTPQQEAAVKVYISKSQGNYSVLGNRCSSPIQNCLKQVGIDTENQMLPVSLGNKLLDMDIANGVKEYHASRSSSGWSAPWAK